MNPEEQTKADKIHNQNLNKGAISLYDELTTRIATLESQLGSGRSREAWIEIKWTLERDLLAEAKDSLRLQIEKQEFDY